MYIKGKFCIIDFLQFLIKNIIKNIKPLKYVLRLNINLRNQFCFNDLEENFYDA